MIGKQLCYVGIKDEAITGTYGSLNTVMYTPWRSFPGETPTMAVQFQPENVTRE